AEKQKEVSDRCLEVFYSYQNDLLVFSYSIASDRKLVAALKSQNTKKAYDAFEDNPEINKYNVEVYNSRLELFLFNGRQLNPEILELKKAYDGTKFSIVKEIGLYTFLIIYEPLKDEMGITQGVLAAASIIDVNAYIQNSYFESRSITSEIFKNYHTSVIFSFDHDTLKSAPEELSGQNYSTYGIKGVNGSLLGKIYIPSLDKDSYLNSVNLKFDNLISFLLFIISLLTILAVYRIFKKTSLLFLQTSLLIITLLLARYFWLLINFPSNFFSDFGSEFFSPVYYASGFGFGMAKSLGELIITSIIIFICSFIVLKKSIIYYQKEQKIKKNILKALLVFAVSIITIFASLQVYGTIVQSVIYDSTIRLIDKTDIFSFNQPELVIARIALLLLSVALLFIIYSTGLMLIKYLNPFLGGYRFIRKNSSLLYIILLIFTIPFMPLIGAEVSLIPTLMILIILISGLFLLYLQRKLNTIQNYNFVNISALSIILLSCAVFIPIIILTKITSQENRYLEKAAREISQRNDEKVKFLVTSTIDELAGNEQLLSNISNKNKAGNLAFTLWSNSSLNDEDVNSAIFILDSKKKLVSDFNIIPAELNSDSVINFVLKQLKTKKLDEISEEETALLLDSAQNDLETVSNLLSAAGDEGLIQNKEMKYYASISEINPTELKGSRFKEMFGYVIVLCSYDSKNYLKQTNLSLFRNFARENILNKLTSFPVFSEFSDGELVGSSNKDVSKSFIKSLTAFRESVKDKADKSALRYDQFENDQYKSFYILSESKPNIPEKIYVVSVKINDFALSSFFFFRYLLFSALIYFIIVFIYVLAKLVRIIFTMEDISILRIGFREKLFASFLIASVVPIIILALYTREYVKGKNEESYKNQLISDLRLIEQVVRNRIQLSIKTEKGNKKDNPMVFTDVFGKDLSESNKNFNLYIKNKLAATTSEQLYKSDLLDTRLSGNSFYNIALLKKDFYTESQQIGDFTFIVGYKPIFDAFNNLIGIISTQTVFKQNEINQELTESLVYILGPYIVAVIILVFSVNVLSYRISNPILKLQKATEQLSKGNIDIEVRSNTTDEIGDLVKSFNRMVKEVKRTQAELKKAERETAWRDIARQVAHEIKNPLTPMKLAMQHMFKAYSSGSKNFETILKSTNKMIIDQIETLNKIATEFSNFAKMPGRKYQSLNIDDILKDVTQLMNAKHNIELQLGKTNGSPKVLGDKDEVKRAIINIVKNSQQALEEKKGSAASGKILISTEQKNGFYYLNVKDNGSGMDMQTLNQLFEPYFSTKSSGMGLGLVITKKILDDMKAKIKIKSKEGMGTEVEVVFKIEK
ncbi:MAG TPA: ATP-binding protein, partial [Ignavibacteria bacterium]